MVISSCSTSKVVISHGIDMSKYSYVVFGEESTGDRVLEDVVMRVKNEIAMTKLIVVSEQEGLAKVALGKFVLYPNIYISTIKKEEVLTTSITITFYDFYTNQSVAVLKSSGFGLIESQSQSTAISSIRKKLNSVYGY